MEFQAAIGEQKRLEQCLREQQSEMTRLRTELHGAQAAQTASMQLRPGWAPLVSGVDGVATPCSAPWDWEAPPQNSGRSFPRCAVGPVCTGPRTCCVAAGGGAAVWCVAGSRSQTVGEA